MTKSTPTTKALFSAIIGLVAAALIVGTINFGPALRQSLQGQDLATSAQARESFVVADASFRTRTKALTRVLTKTPLEATTVVAVQPVVTPTTTASEAAGNYAVADDDEYDDDEEEEEEDEEDDEDDESEDD
jgi:hypothetical protein